MRWKRTRLSTPIRLAIKRPAKGGPQSLAPNGSRTHVSSLEGWGNSRYTTGAIVLVACATQEQGCVRLPSVPLKPTEPPAYDRRDSASRLRDPGTRLRSFGGHTQMPPYDRRDCRTWLPPRIAQDPCQDSQYAVAMSRQVGRRGRRTRCPPRPARFQRRWPSMPTTTILAAMLFPDFSMASSTMRRRPEQQGTSMMATVIE